MYEPGEDRRVGRLEAENERLRLALGRVAWTAFRVGREAGRTGATVWVPRGRPPISFRRFCDELASAALETNRA